MIKAFLLSFALIIAFGGVYASDLFGFLSSSTMFYIAFGLVILMLVIARIILGNPYVKDEKNDESDE